MQQQLQLSRRKPKGVSFLKPDYQREPMKISEELYMASTTVSSCLWCLSEFCRKYYLQPIKKVRSGFYFGIGWVMKQQGNENATECLKPLDQLLCSVPLHEAVTFLCNHENHGEWKEPSQWMSLIVCWCNLKKTIPFNWSENWSVICGKPQKVTFLEAEC